MATTPSSKPLSPVEAQAELIAFGNMICTARLAKIEAVLEQVKAKDTTPIDALMQIEVLCSPV
jgi:hypothetical protein